MSTYPEGEEVPESIEDTLNEVAQLEGEAEDRYMEELYNNLVETRDKMVELLDELSPENEIGIQPIEYMLEGGEDSSVVEVYSMLPFTNRLIKTVDELETSDEVANYARSLYEFPHNGSKEAIERAIEDNFQAALDSVENY